MKIMITIDTIGSLVTVDRRVFSARGNGSAETLIQCSLDTRTSEEVAGLVAKTVGIAVAEAIAAAGGE